MVKSKFLGFVEAPVGVFSFFLTSLREPTFYADLHYLFLLLDTHIVYKDISSLHELTFYGILGQILLLLDTHIAHKDILFLYELIFYAVLD